MPTVLQFRRGTTAQNNAFTGSAGEVSIDTDLDTFRIHDGSTAGGFEITQNTATQTLTNKTLTSPTITGTGAIAGLFTGALTGNADTATILATTRAIEVSGAVTGTANFDGSAAINIVTTATSDPTITLGGDLTGSVTLTNLASGTLTATIAANSVALGTDTTGNYVATGAVSGTGLSGSAGSEGATFTVTSNATSANTANTIVARDGTGNFTAGVITATATAARYADLAERYTADSDYDPGTVLIFDGALEVTVSNQDASPKVAGVVSTDPAYLMNSDLQGTLTVALALTGRVPTKVIGPVHKGDMMVSTADGRARAESNPAMGTVIGKALEDFSGTEGTIEVVVGRL
jgi:hypothetical protein